MKQRSGSDHPCSSDLLHPRLAGSCHGCSDAVARHANTATDEPVAASLRGQDFPPLALAGARKAEREDLTSRLPGQKISLDAGAACSFEGRPRTGAALSESPDFRRSAAGLLRRSSPPLSSWPPKWRYEKFLPLSPPLQTPSP